MKSGNKRRRLQTLEFGAAKPSSTSGIFLDEMRRKESYQRLLSLPDGEITPSRNPGSEIFERFKKVVLQLEQLHGTKEENQERALELLKEAFEMLMNVVIDQKRNQYFAGEDVLEELRKRHNGDSAALQRSYNRVVSERKARFVQDTQETLINFAAMYEVARELANELPNHDFSVIPGSRNDTGEAVDQLLAERHAIADEVRGRTIPGGLADPNLPIPEIPKAPPRMKTDPLLYGGLETQEDVFFDRVDLEAQHDVKVASVREQSFVGKLRDIAPQLLLDDSQPPSSPKKAEKHEVSEAAALKDFERLFVPLFEETLMVKVRDYGGNFQEAIRAIASRTFINAGQDNSPFHAYVEKNMAQNGSPQPIYRKFALTVMEKRARKVKNRFTEPMHEYLQDRLKPAELVQLSPEALDYEVSQTVKWMFSTVYQWLVNGSEGKELGPFVWLSYYYDPYNREKALDFYKDVHGIITTMYKDAIERHQREQPVDEGFSETERITRPDMPKNVIAPAPTIDIEDEVTQPNFKLTDVFDSLSAPSSPEPSIEVEEEPVPYSTTSDLPPRDSEEVTTIRSSFPNTLPPPHPEMDPPAPVEVKPKREEPTRTVEHVEDEHGEAVTREFFVSRDKNGNVRKVAKQPPAAGDVAEIQPLPPKHDGGVVDSLERQAPRVAVEPSVIINTRRETEMRKQDTLPSKRREGVAAPVVPKAPRVPSFVDQKESTPDAETAKRKALPEVRPSRWSQWSSRTKKRLGALAVVAAAGVAALIGVRSQQTTTDNVDPTTHKTVEPPKQIPPQKVAPAPTANVVKPPVQDDPSEVGPKPAPNLDEPNEKEVKMGVTARIDLSKVRGEKLRNALATGATPDDGMSSYSSQILSVMVHGQPLNNTQIAQLKELRDKINRGSYASAMNKWGSIPAHRLKEMAAPGSTYEERSLLRTFIKLYGDPSKWMRQARNPDTGESAPYQEVYRKEMEYYEQKYEAEFLAYGMGDNGNIHTRKPNNRTIQLQKDGRWTTYAFEVGKIVGYFEEDTKTGMLDRPKAPGQELDPLRNAPGHRIQTPGQKYGFLNTPSLQNRALYPDDKIPANTARAFTSTADKSQRLVNPGSSKNVNMSFITAGADRYTQQVNEHPANILHLSNTYRLIGGTTFWQLIENQIEQCGQPDRVKEAARRCLNKWRARGVNDLPFSVVASDAQGVTVSIKDKKFLDDMTNTVAMAHGGYGKLAGQWFLKGGPNDPRNKPRTKAPAVAPSRFAHIKAGAEAYKNNPLKIGGTIVGTKTVAQVVQNQIIASRLAPDVEKFVLSGLRYYQKQGQPMYANVTTQADGTITKDIHPKLVSYLKRVMDTKVNPQPSISERVAAAKVQKEAEEHAAFMVEAKTLNGADIVELNGVPKVWRVPRAEAMRPIEYIEKAILDSLTWQAVNATNDRARVAALVAKKQHVSAICTAMRNAYKKKFIPSVKPFVDFPLPERWHTKLADALGSDWTAEQYGPYVEPRKASHPPLRYAAAEEEAPVSGVRRRAGIDTAPALDDVA